MTIRVTQEIMAEMRRHGERTYPEECCGALFGTEDRGDRTIVRVREIENSREENRGRRFLITPLQYKAVDEESESLGLQLLGFYHSHPDHPAVPSQYDREHAAPWLTYVIVSVVDGKGKEVTAWQLGSGGESFEQCPTEVERREELTPTAHGRTK